MRILFLEKRREGARIMEERIEDTFLHAEINEETVRFNAP